MCCTIHPWADFTLNILSPYPNPNNFPPLLSELITTSLLCTYVGLQSVGLGIVWGEVCVCVCVCVWVRESESVCVCVLADSLNSISERCGYQLSCENKQSWNLINFPQKAFLSHFTCAVALPCVFPPSQVPGGRSRPYLGNVFFFTNREE